MAVEENSWLFGLIPLAKSPFTLRTLEQDLERIKIYYLEIGWLDILKEDRVFISDLRFSRDKSLAFITIHVEEGIRYRVKSVSVKGNSLFTDDELIADLKLKEGEYYDRSRINRDLKKLRNLYGERAYINAAIRAQEIYGLEGDEVSVLYDIIENDKAYVGSLTFTGNDKTRDDVLRREFTRVGFVPGSEYNLVAFNRAVRRIRDRRWLDVTSQGGGIRPRREPGLIPDTQDVVIDISEGDTGSVRFAAGYSSAFGILGIFEVTQRNFDLADLPGSLAEVFNGDGFSGGGQTLRLRLAPARKRQSYSIDFVEPYFFGYELQQNFRLSQVTITRESWDEERKGFSLGFDKRLDPWVAGISFNFLELTYNDLDDRVPRIVEELEGENDVLTLTPALLFDTRDSSLLPTEGARIQLTWEYGGQILAGDFDYNKYVLDTDFFFPVYEVDDDLFHVFALDFKFGWVNEKRRMEEVPISERFFLGGRGSVRGFDFRGIGPRDRGDPIGGESVVFASAEYVVPLGSRILRGAVFIDGGILEDEIGDLHKSKPRYAAGFGIRFVIPELGNVPVALDFAWPLWKDDDDDRQTITFDIGQLF
jgi:outer membrane protein insertion porin family